MQQPELKQEIFVSVNDPYSMHCGQEHATQVSVWKSSSFMDTSYYTAQNTWQSSHMYQKTNFTGKLHYTVPHWTIQQHIYIWYNQYTKPMLLVHNSTQNPVNTM